MGRQSRSLQFFYHLNFQLPPPNRSNNVISQKCPFKRTLKDTRKQKTAFYAFFPIFFFSLGAPHNNDEVLFIFKLNKGTFGKEVLNSGKSSEGGFKIHIRAFFHEAIVTVIFRIIVMNKRIARNLTVWEISCFTMIFLSCELSSSCRERCHLYATFIDHHHQTHFHFFLILHSLVTETTCIRLFKSNVRMASVVTCTTVAWLTF